MSLYGTPVFVALRKSKPGPPLAETKQLVIDYKELNKQIPRAQMTQVKQKGSLAIIKTTKISLEEQNTLQVISLGQDTIIF